MSMIFGQQWRCWGKVQVAVVAALVALGMWLTVFRGVAATADGSQPPAQTDPMAYANLSSLRQDLGLTSTDLALAGCDASQARQVITGLIAWEQTNRAALAQLQEQKTLAYHAMAVQAVKRSTGTGDNATYLMARQGYVSACQNLQRLYESAALVASINPSLYRAVSDRLTAQAASFTPRPRLSRPVVVTSAISHEAQDNLSRSSETIYQVESELLPEPRVPQDFPVRPQEAAGIIPF